MEKIYFVRFHPLARDILVSASYDMTVRIWDLTNGSEVMQLEGHTDAVRGRGRWKGEESGGRWRRKGEKGETGGRGKKGGT